MPSVRPSAAGFGIQRGRLRAGLVRFATRRRSETRNSKFESAEQLTQSARSTHRPSFRAHFHKTDDSNLYYDNRLRLIFISALVDRQNKVTLGVGAALTMRRRAFARGRPRTLRPGSA